MNTNTIEVRVYKEATQDDYNMGEIGSTTTFGLIESFSCDSLSEALEKITVEYGKPAIFEERLECQRMEDSEGQEATDGQMRRWKAGEFPMWSARYSFYVSSVQKTVVGNSLLRAAFPTLEEL